MLPIRPILLAILLFILFPGCSSDTPPGRAGSGRLSDPTVPESWVTPQWSPAWWTVLADVHDFVPTERWDALDTAWMVEKARTDLEEWGPKNQNPSEHMLSGLWRLGLLRPEVMAAVDELGGEAVWPLDPKLRLVAWEPRIMCWRRDHPEDGALEAKLAESWQAAVAVDSIRTAGRVIRAYELCVGSPVPESLRAEAHAMVSDELADIDRNYHIDEGLLVLLESFGVPEGVDLKPVLAAVRRRYDELEDAVIPLPAPYDLHLACLRLSRLMAR